MKTRMLVPGSAACCGCGACVTVCPRQAISMEPDDTGCLFPVIDESRCVDCGTCVRACAYGKEAGNTPLAAYAAVWSNDQLVRDSASGGVFAALAQSVIASDGLAAGAVMDCTEDVAVYHILAADSDGICRMQGSKYVQSEAWRCYEAVRFALKRGRTVLFSGTPCQAAAVKRLTGDPDNLITIDLICHGVPPRRMLAEFIVILEARFCGRIKAFRFRDKACSKSFCAGIDMERGGKTRRYYLQARFLSFYKLFLDGAIYRENCYSSPYARKKRVSDLTIGDYWGIEKFHEPQLHSGEIEHRSDWSCILVNTEKGQKFLADHSGSLRLIPSEAAWIARENRQLNTPAPVPAGRTQIMAAYRSGGYRAVEQDYIRQNGGIVRFFWRMFRNLRRNAQKATERTAL